MRLLSSFLLVISLFFTGLFLPLRISAQTDFVLQDGTPIKLRMGRNMSSADAKTGETVDFEVLEDVKIGDVIVIPRGGVANGTVTQGKPKGRMGKGGKLDINIDYARTVAGEKVALRAIKENKGGSSTGAMTGAIVASSILFFPAAPFFLFMKGKDIKIPKGTEITAYVSGDSSLDKNKYINLSTGGSASQTTEGPTPIVAAPASSLSSIAVKSSPDGAEISIDGKFMGSTPSSLTLKPGDYTISITRPGYKTWERKMTLNPNGTITIDATLEKMP